MKSTEAGIRFPAFGFTTDGEFWRFTAIEVLNSCGPQAYKSEMQSGMELIDSDFRRWRVTSVGKLGRQWSILAFLFLTTWTFRVELELEAQAPASWPEIQDRIATYFLGNAWNFEADGDEEERVELRADYLRRIKGAQTLPDMFEIFGADDLMGY